MKTLNENMDFFRTHAQAKRAFDSSPKNCDLLQVTGKNEFFIERKIDGNDSAFECWPKLYTLLESK